LRSRKGIGGPIKTAMPRNRGTIELKLTARNRSDRLCNTSKQVGNPEHIKVFANADAAETRFEEHDPEGVAFEYEVLE
jgi:hypothetical protein